MFGTLFGDECGTMAGSLPNMLLNIMKCVQTNYMNVAKQVASINRGKGLSSPFGGGLLSPKYRPQSTSQ